MRTQHRPAAFAALACAAALLACGGRPASAQAEPPLTKAPPVATVRGGIYLPFNARVKNAIGNTWYGGGIDYAFQQKPTVSRTVLSVDYIERSTSNYNIRIFPVTIGEFSLSGGAQNGVRPYFGVGAGVYFIRQTIPNDVGFSESNSTTALGGYLAAGLDLPANLMIEGRYHILEKVGSANSSGLQLMAGFRF